jgi:hypothetical protein
MKSLELSKVRDKINSKVNELLQGLDKSGNLNFFEITIKNTDGDLLFKVENTYKEKI